MPWSAGRISKDQRRGQHGSALAPGTNCVRSAWGVTPDLPLPASPGVSPGLPVSGGPLGEGSLVPQAGHRPAPRRLASKWAHSPDSDWLSWQLRLGLPTVRSTAPSTPTPDGSPTFSMSGLLLSARASLSASAISERSNSTSARTLPTCSSCVSTAASMTCRSHSARPSRIHRRLVQSVPQNHWYPKGEFPGSRFISCVRWHVCSPLLSDSPNVLSARPRLPCLSHWEGVASRDRRQSLGQVYDPLEGLG